MANDLAIYSVGESLRKYLENAYPEELRTLHACSFRLLSSGELVDTSNVAPALSLYLYRVTMNEHLRNHSRAGHAFDGSAPLAIDLHSLLTVWANNSLAEHAILSWAMRELYQHPILDKSSLTADANWSSADVIQLIPAELSTEDIMRIWDALNPPYHLSLSYIARVVRIDAEAADSARPVVANRFAYTDREVPA